MSLYAQAGPSHRRKTFRTKKIRPFTGRILLLGRFLHRLFFRQPQEFIDVGYRQIDGCLPELHSRNVLAQVAHSQLLDGHPPRIAQQGVVHVGKAGPFLAARVHIRSG